MAEKSILYYPSIEFQSIEWVKSSILLWDRIYRIVPEGYIPDDSDEIKELIDNDLIRNIHLTKGDKEQTANDFVDFYQAIKDNRAAGLIVSDDERIHPDKIDNILYPYLDEIGPYFFDDDNWLHMSGPMTRSYMFILSKVVANRRNMVRGTENLEAWAISPYFSERGNFAEFVQDSSAKGFYSSCILEDIFPANIADIDVNEIISFIENNKEGKVELREKLTSFISEASKISENEQFIQEGLDLIHDINSAKDEYKKNMAFWEGGMPGKILSTGLPLSINVFDALNAANDPFKLLRIGSILIGAIASYADYRKTKKKRDPSYSSYLYGLDNLPSSQVIGRSFTSFEEFIND